MAAQAFLLISFGLMFHTLAGFTESTTSMNSSEDSETSPSTSEIMSLNILNQSILNLQSILIMGSHSTKVRTMGTEKETGIKVESETEELKLETTTEELTKESVTQLSLNKNPSSGVDLAQPDAAHGNETQFSMLAKMEIEQLVKNDSLLGLLPVPLIFPPSDFTPRSVRPSLQKFTNTNQSESPHSEVLHNLFVSLEAQVCRSQETIEGGYIEWPEHQSTGSMLKYICPEGYRAFPVSWRVCNRLGHWSQLRNIYGETANVAKCISLKCLSPSYPDQGFFYPIQRTYEVNDTIHYECFSGYYLRGSASRSCLPNGQWSGKMAVCYSTDSLCPNPGTPIGGSRMGNYFGLFAVVKYSCGENVLRGSATRKCLESGRWSGEQPRCESWYAFDSTEDLAKEMNILEVQVQLSAELSEDKDLKPLSGKSHKFFFLIDASSSMGEENFAKSLNFTKTFVEKVSEYGTQISFGVIFFGIYPFTNVKLKDGLTLEDVVMAMKAIIGKAELMAGPATSPGAALTEVQHSVLTDPNVTNTKYTIIIITSGRHKGMKMATLQNIMNHVKKSGSDLDVLAIGIGDINKKELESLAVSKETEEEGRQYTFHLLYYDDLEKVFKDMLTKDNSFSQCGIQGLIPQRPVGRIFGGRSSVRGDWPWQVLIKLPDDICGGSVIGNVWILSAAHCFETGDGKLYEPIDILVYFGILDIRKLETENQTKVKAIIRHENWNVSTNDYDIALLKLTKTIKYSKTIRPVCLPCMEDTDRLLSSVPDSWSDFCSYQENFFTFSQENKQHIPISGYIAGWGVIYKRIRSLELMYAKVDLMPKYECKSRYPFTKNMFCARGPATDACQGDSGGPFVMKIKNRWIQIGIISFGRYGTCGEKDFMGFYTNVPRLMSWIHTNMQTN